MNKQLEQKYEDTLLDVCGCLNILAAKCGIQVEGACLKSDAEDYGTFNALDNAGKLLKEISLLKSQEVHPSEICPICEKTHLVNGVCEVCTKALCSPFQPSEGKDAEEIGSKIFEVLNAWVYNETNQAGDTLNIIDACDLPIIIPRIVESLSLPAKVSEPRNEQLTCPHTYHTQSGYCKYCGLYNADKNIL